MEESDDPVDSDGKIIMSSYFVSLWKGMLVFINPNNEERYFKILNQIQYKTYCFVNIAEECVGEKFGLDFFDSLSYICIQTKIKILWVIFLEFILCM